MVICQDIASYMSRGILSRMRLDRVRPSAMYPVSSSKSGSEAMSEIHPSTASPYTFACFVELRVVPASKCANIATVQFPTQGMPLQHSSLWKSVCRCLKEPPPSYNKSVAPLELALWMTS